MPLLSHRRFMAGPSGAPPCSGAVRDTTQDQPPAKPGIKVARSSRRLAGLSHLELTQASTNLASNMPLNLTKSPLRWPTIERCLTGAFAG